MSDCIFCKIIKKDIPANILYEDDVVIAFLDIMACSPGHTVVIPKQHLKTIFDFSEQELGAIFERVKKVGTAIKSSELKPDGLTVGMNHHQQEVPHLHIHILPRWEGDGDKAMQSIVQNKTEEPLESIAEKIKSAL
jgi:histidine triad (HIT) family protein